MRELPIIACTLDAGGQAQRVEEFRSLFRTSLVRAERVDDTAARLHFEPSAEQAVRALAAAETTCCSFWSFTFEQTGDTVVLLARTPLDAVPILEGLLALAD